MLRRQKLVPSGFKHMVDTLHNSGKFRPFVATMLMAWLSEDGKVHFEWQVTFQLCCLACHLHLHRAEAVPRGIHVRQPFEKKYDQVVKDCVNSMYAWAEQPLKGTKQSLEWPKVLSDPCH